MDYIKKKICLEVARTRTQGLVPYYELGKAYGQHEPYYVSVCNECDYEGDDVFDECPRCGSKDVEIKPACKDITSLGLEPADGPNGNWGQFPANPCFLAKWDKTYMGMLHAYYSLLNMVRDGIRLRKVSTKDGEVIFTGDLGAFELKGECFDAVTEPDYLYEYAAYDASGFHATEIDSLRPEARKIYRTSQDVPQKFVVLIDDFERFKVLASYLDGTGYSELDTGINIETGDAYYKWARYCQVVDFCIGKINIPAWIFNKHIKVPKSMPCADVEPYIDWLRNYQALSADCCNLRLYEDMGGKEFLDYLVTSGMGKCEDISNKINSPSFEYAVPYIEMPLLLTQTFTDVGVLTNVEGKAYDDSLFGPSASPDENTRPHGTLRISKEGSGFTEQREIDGIVMSGKGICIDQIIMSGKSMTYPASWEVESEDAYPHPFKTESLIRTLRSPKRYTDDEDNLLPGLFRKFDDPAGQMYKCEKNGNEWVMTATGSTGLENGDGKSSAEVRNTSFYRSITVAEAGRRLAEAEEIEGGEKGGYYYFKVKYDNSPEKPMTLPYATGNTANLYLVDEETHLYRGDYISGIDRSTYPGEVVFTYVVGGYFYMDDDDNVVPAFGGDIYKERYAVDSGHVETAVIDGVDGVPVYSEYIDFDGAAEEFYSPRYNLYRTGNTACIVEMDTAAIWDPQFSFDAYLTKEEYLTGFSMPPKVDVNVTVDRGGVSAFERHYKLAECNTMQDLMQYNNSEFFPEI